MFIPRNSITGDSTGALTHFVVSNGVTITQGYAVTLVGGYVEVIANTGEALLGVAAETVTGDGSKKVGVHTDPNTIYYNDADGNLAQADVGKVYRTTAGFKIDQSTGAVNTAYPFILVGIDPDGDGDASKGLFKPYRTQLLSNRENV